MKAIIKKIIPGFLINWYHFLLAFLGAIVYRFPSRKLTVIGVTGTNGKTTTVNLATKILEEAGYRVASASSIKFKIGNREEENKLKMTMPGRFQLQKFLRQAVRAGCKYVVLEVTSEGILQHRHRFIDFAAAVFTNLSPEHIERHGSFGNYRETKGKFFKICKGTHIINIDDKNADYFLQFPAEIIYGYGITNHESRITNLKIVQAKEINVEDKSISFLIHNSKFVIRLLGKFNINNALAAICIGLSQGVSLEQCKQALAKVKGVPGRMEKVISSPFRVIVDYAFTPNALKQVYECLTSQVKHLICVLGACGGGRDKWKRKILGEIAAKYCKEIIITNEDPYDEDPMEIINQVANGAGIKARTILDRREAIRKSLEMAQPSDTIIITGKGCEPWICIANNEKIPWDDRQVAREEFQKLYEKV